MNTHEHALAAAKRGWPIFPLAAGTKVPLGGTNGPLSATTDIDVINQWFLHGVKFGEGTTAKGVDVDLVGHKDMNYGIATDPAGLVVIDIDVPKEDYNKEDRGELFGIEAWCMLVMNAALKKEPRTYEVWTPSGGEHLYWLANKHLPIRTATAQLAPGIDVRAVNGTIVGAGSKTPKGTYEVHKNIDPKPLPSWLRTALGRAQLAVSDVERATQPVREPTKVSNPDRYVASAFNGELETLRATPIGQGMRNRNLNHAAFKLSKFVTESKLTYAEVANALYRVAVEELNMQPREAEATINSGLTAR